MRHQGIEYFLSKVLLSVILASQGGYSWGQLAIPVSPAMQSQDEVRSRDGVQCRSQRAQSSVEAGVTQSNPQVNQNALGFTQYNPYGSGTQVYARISIPLGSTKGQVNCNSLYELEIERLKHELEELKKNKGTLVKVD